jgi:Ferritin-like domain
LYLANLFASFEWPSPFGAAASAEQEASMNELCTTSSESCIDEVAVGTRRHVLRRGAAIGAAVLGGGVLVALRPEAADPAPSASMDRKIFTFALQLEHLQAAFYKAAVEAGALSGEVLGFATTLARHEREHVQFLRKALGAPDDPPEFDFGKAVQSRSAFLATAVLLENTGVAAYNGQAANLTKKSLAAAAEIVSVEGRHAAWASSLAGREPAPRAADPGATAHAVARTLARTGFQR